jgi:hypothetical protein
MLVLAVACAGSQARDGDAANAPPAVIRLESLESPAAPSSGEPSLTADAAGRVYLSWLEPGPDSVAALRLAVLEGDRWGPPRTIASHPKLMVNWADFPSLLATTGGRLVAHWLQRPDSGGKAYGIRLAQSSDGGATWSAPIVPHRGHPWAEYGFVAMWPMAGDSVGLAWLDARKDFLPDSGHEMMLTASRLAPDGSLGAEEFVDQRTCDCCQTGVAVASGGPVLAYRDRSADEVRDVQVVRHTAGGWTAPTPVHADGWHIEACPVNGPQVAASGDTVAIAWFTAARDTARVNVAFSSDGGATFGAPIRVDDGQPGGRVDVELGPDGRALVTWIERTGADAAPAVPAPRTVGAKAEVRLRAVAPDGARSASVTVAQSDAARAAGFPRMVRTGDRLVLAWTEPGTPARVRVARATLPASTALASR